MQHKNYARKPGKGNKKYGTHDLSAARKIIEEQKRTEEKLAEEAYQKARKLQRHTRHGKNPPRKKKAQPKQTTNAPKLPHPSPTSDATRKEPASTVAESHGVALDQKADSHRDDHSEEEDEREADDEPKDAEVIGGNEPESKEQKEKRKRKYGKAKNKRLRRNRGRDSASPTTHG